MELAHEDAILGESGCQCVHVYICVSVIVRCDCLPKRTCERKFRNSHSLFVGLFPYL